MSVENCLAADSAGLSQNHTICTQIQKGCHILSSTIYQARHSVYLKEERNHVVQEFQFSRMSRF